MTPVIPLARRRLRHQTLPKRRWSSLGSPHRHRTHKHTILVLAMDPSGRLHPQRAQHGCRQSALPAVQTKAVAHDLALVYRRHLQSQLCLWVYPAAVSMQAPAIALGCWRRAMLG